MDERSEYNQRPTRYNLEPLETFPTRVSLVRSSPDGERLFVPTSNQVAYALDVSSAAAAVPAAASN